MIRPETPSRFSPGAERALAPPPWERRGELLGLAFATLWATGPDPRSDGVFRLAALRRDPDTGTWEAFEGACDPGFADGSDRSPAASARMAREFGVTATDLAEAPAAAELFRDLEEFLRGRVVVVADRAAFRAWATALHGAGELPFTPVDPTTLAGLFLPGRIASEGETLPLSLLGARGQHGPHADGRARRAIGPAELRSALAVLTGRIIASDEATLAVLATSYLEIWRELAGGNPEGARELAFFLRLCEHPSVWCGGDSLFPEHAALGDGRLSDALRIYGTLDDALEACMPRWTRAAGERGEPAGLGVAATEPVTLSPADRRVVDEIFQEHLPRHFAERSAGTAPSYREGQHELAARIAERFGERELLLMHAPTGTGKTLAYLVPTMIWAFRNDVRVGVATYTRALQEQAMELEVPLALAMLRRAGFTGGLRVSVLKGRQNYVCWRALTLQQPGAGDGTEERLAWTRLALFALTDPEGDLDRLPLRPPLAAVDAGAWRGAVGKLLRQVRAETGCCATQADRSTCGAEGARRRAERAHVVITNHAFALSRREFFRHLVFDECEHLHDVAHDAFSHAVSLKSLQELFARFHRPGAPSQRPLSRVLSTAVTRSAAWVHAHTAAEALAKGAKAASRLQGALGAFEVWRDQRLSERQETDFHTLFREYALQPEAQELLDLHETLLQAVNELAAELAQLAEHLDAVPTAGVPRIRRALELLRGELGERLAGIEAWIPRGPDGVPAFRSEIFYDLESTQAGAVLLARVLLPNEILGRHYLPDLRGAVFLSATTWLKGGFETAATYLGLDRAANPDEDEEREPCAVATFRAPDAFDYGRVLVAIPRDAPSIRDDKSGFLDYVQRFVGHLAERTRGRLLVLFTNADDLCSVGIALEGFFAERHIPFWYQRMEGTSKEELSELFRTHTDSVLFGLDTFWYGADFPGATLEYLVLVRLPYGVPDRYHHAQCAALGPAEQRRQIYMPRALAKFRQGFGRLMRKESDRGCVFLLDNRILDPRHRVFLKELPVRRPFDGHDEGAELVVGSTERCLDAAFAHMAMKADIRRRGLATGFESGCRP